MQFPLADRMALRKYKRNSPPPHDACDFLSLSGRRAEHRASGLPTGILTLRALGDLLARGLRGAIIELRAKPRLAHRPLPEAESGAGSRQPLAGGDPGTGPDAEPRFRKSDGLTHAATAGPGVNAPGSSSASRAMTGAGSATSSG